MVTFVITPGRWGHPSVGRNPDANGPYGYTGSGRPRLVAAAWTAQRTGVGPEGVRGQRRLCGR
jgi:hypothetical protein